MRQSTMEAWHRRHAIVLASQLPDNVEDARLVLEATCEIVESFLAPKVDKPLPENVVRIGGNERA
jgi:hypothetical protein